MIGILLIRLIQLYIYVVVLRVLLSWFIQDPSNPIMGLLAQLTDPLLRPLGRHLNFGGLDLSPIALLMLLTTLQRVIAGTLAG